MGESQSNIRRYCSFLCTPVLDNCGVFRVSANGTLSIPASILKQEHNTGIGYRTSLLAPSNQQRTEALGCRHPLFREREQTRVFLNTLI